MKNCRMKKQGFALYPFAIAGSLSSPTINGDILRYSNKIALNYNISSLEGGMLIPPPSEIKVRKNKLWEDTCFELFLADKIAPAYWEFNLSPSGCWNVYRYESYRKGMKEEIVFSELPFNVLRDYDALTLCLDLDIGKIIRPELKLEAGICAVIKDADGALAYWALTHRGERPDFHRRDSFIISI
jgi:hypothetical protein